MSKKFKLILLAAILILTCNILFSQISNHYAFKHSTAVWEPVWGPYANAAMVDEGLTSELDIGFSFPYAGSTFTQVKISSNGWINLGTNLTQPFYGNDLSYLNVRPILAPLWDDLSMDFGAVQYATTGVAPYRIFYVHWLSARWNYSAMNEFSFMVRMHESGQVDFIYGPHIGTPNNPSASIGINMVPGGSGNYFSVLPGTGAVVFSNTSINNISAIIPEETMYLFMPKTGQAANVAAVNLYGSQTLTQYSAEFYTVTAGNAGTSPIDTLTAAVYLMRGEEILASAYLPAMPPGSFSETILSWTPDTFGQMGIYAKVALDNDTDSLNNQTAPLPINVQEFVSNDDETTPAGVLYISAQPNPFRERVVLQFNPEKNEPLSLKIYNVKGRLVRDLLKQGGLVPPPGKSTVIDWNGLDDRGNPVANGTYLCRLTSGKSVVMKKIVRLR